MNFKKILRNNQIKDCPVVEKDVDLAEAIFGPDVATLKKKTVRRTPGQIVTDTVSILSELVRKHSSIELCMDIIYVNKIGFLTTSGYPIYYRKTSHVKDGKKDTVYSALDQILRIWNSGSFHVQNFFVTKDLDKL